MAQTHTPQLYNGIFGTRDHSVKWVSFLMVDVFEALHSDRSVDFSNSAPNKQLICGHDQLSLEELASLLSQGCNTWQFYGYYLSSELQSLMSSSITLNAHRAHDVAYDLQLAKRYAASLHLLHYVCNAFSKHGVRLARQNQSQSYTILAVVRMASIGWTNLMLYFHKTMKEMLEESSVTGLYTATFGSDGIDIIDGLDGYGNGGLDGVDGLEGGTYNYSLLAELELAPVFLAVRTLTCGDLKKWVEFVIDVTNAGTRIMSASEGTQTLERLRDGLKIACFSWTGYTNLVEVIDSRVSALKDSSVCDPAHIFTLDHHPDYHGVHPNPLSDSHPLPQSGSATATDLGYNPDIYYCNLDFNSGHVPSAHVPPGAGISPYDPLFSGYASRSSHFFKS
ncbi:hypothetical protein D9758_016279 [Tetrapyrgos nigripes]|uniref:Uncharacterized protein n=1 Tax=Tetrapyrgos nigripes TaxID=182062 RepID=A0A8H5CA07_9AGAR|nr:hypothetical protein D9758_016279 [Tetrapyrgos nigripes]